MTGRISLISVTIILLLSALVRISPAEKFDSEQFPEVANLAPDSVRSALIEALKDAGENWRELATVVEQLEGEKREDAVWLVNHMPHLDRLEMKSGVLREHIDYAHLARDSAAVLYDREVFREYILTYRIGSEPVEAYRKFLCDHFRPRLRGKESVEEIAEEINRWVARSISITEKGFFGPLQPPTATLKSGKGSEREVAILVAAIFKSLGIPSRQARIAALGEEEEDLTWVEILEGERWLPFYPFSPGEFGNFDFVEGDRPYNVTVVLSRSAFERKLITSDYTPSGWLKATFLEDGKPRPNFEHLSVNVFNKGAFRALDDLFLNDYVDYPTTDSSGVYVCELGDGHYFLQAGLREKGGDVWVEIVPFEIIPGDTTFLEVELSPPEE